MEPYTRLARHYDALQTVFDASAWADFYQKIWRRAGLAPVTVLDLACGTGALAAELLGRGYDVVGTDTSADMLAVAAGRIQGDARALLLQQSMEELDLYGTVPAAVCSLDGINHLRTRAALQKTLARVRLFLEPGGVFVFDVLTPAHFRRIDGLSESLEAEGVFCVWQNSVRGSRCIRRLDLFERKGSAWSRYTEEHMETEFALDFLEDALRLAGFGRVRRYGPLRLRPPRPEEERVFFAAW